MFQSQIVWYNNTNDNKTHNTVIADGANNVTLYYGKNKDGK